MEFNNIINILKLFQDKKKLRELFNMEKISDINSLRGILYNGVIFESSTKQQFQIISEYWTFRDNKFEEVIAYDIYDDTKKNIIKVEHKKMLDKIMSNSISVTYKPTDVIPSTLVITNNEIKLTIENLL